MNCHEINIDCYGSSHLPCVTVNVADTIFNFIYNDEQKKGKAFTYALYVDDAALSNRYFYYPHDRRLCLLIESPIREIFAKIETVSHRYKYIFTHWKPLIQSGEPYVPFYYGTTWLGSLPDNTVHNKDKLVSFIGSILHSDIGGYQLRKTAALRFMKNSRVECFGYGIREIQGKIEALSEYAFSIAFENIKQDYYFTEKLIDCFLTDTVPVYWGCPGIGNFFDIRGIITFNTLDELLEIVENLSMERYAEMLPYVRINKQRAIDRNFHTLDGLYKRLADYILTQIGEKPPVLVRLMIFTIFKKLYRYLRSKIEYLKF
jgi:Glycosyltransferase family 10 (fucosyltransferase) C-term